MTLFDPLAPAPETRRGNSSGMVPHTCHHPRCKLSVPPRMLACNPHWSQLPKPLRDMIWKAYRPGQEVDKQPSEFYLKIMHQCIKFWEENP